MRDHSPDSGPSARSVGGIVTSTEHACECLRASPPSSVNLVVFSGYLCSASARPLGVLFLLSTYVHEPNEFRRWCQMRKKYPSGSEMGTSFRATGAIFNAHPRPLLRAEGNFRLGTSSTRYNFGNVSARSRDGEESSKSTPQGRPFDSYQSDSRANSLINHYKIDSFQLPGVT